MKGPLRCGPFKWDIPTLGSSKEKKIRRIALLAWPLGPL